MNIQPYNENIWFSPGHVIDELRRTCSSGDKKKIQRHKEAWVCSLSMLLYQTVEPSVWWIQVPKNDPPDVLTMKLVPHKNGLGNSMYRSEIEIFELTSHDSNEKILDSITRKIGNKDYANTTLIGFVMRRSVIDGLNITSTFQREKPKVSQIWLLVNEFNKHVLIQVYPFYFKSTPHHISEFKKIEQDAFITLTRSTKVKPRIQETTNDVITIVP